MISSAVPLPSEYTGGTVPSCNAAEVLKERIAAADVYNFDAFCTPILCGQVHNVGADLVQAFLSYISMQNLNNYLNAFWEAFQTSIVLGTTADLTDTFFTNTAVNPTWQSILQVISPRLGGISAALGAIPEAATLGVVIGVVGSVASVAAAGANTALSGIYQDQSYREFGNIQDFIAKCFSAASHGIEKARSELIGDANPIRWTGSNVVGPSDPGHFGLMG